LNVLSDRKVYLPNQIVDKNNPLMHEQVDRAIAEYMLNMSTRQYANEKTPEEHMACFEKYAYPKLDEKKHVIDKVIANWYNQAALTEKDLDFFVDEIRPTFTQAGLETIAKEHPDLIKRLGIQYMEHIGNTGLVIKSFLYDAFSEMKEFINSRPVAVTEKTENGYNYVASHTGYIPISADGTQIDQNYAQRNDNGDRIFEETDIEKYSRLFWYNKNSTGGVDTRNQLVNINGEKYIRLFGHIIAPFSPKFKDEAGNTVSLCLDGGAGYWGTKYSPASPAETRGMQLRSFDTKSGIMRSINKKGVINEIAINEWQIGETQEEGRSL